MATRRARAETEKRAASRGQIRTSALALLAAIVVSAGVGAAPAAAEDPQAVPWTEILPSLPGGYEPSSSNLCRSGKVQCVDAVIREMTRRFDPLAAACSHNAMFSLMYLRTTEQYRVSVEDPDFFSDNAFVNHQDAIFAQYYFDAWDDYYRGRPTPQAWAIAFQAADGQKVSSLGNMLLGMSGHVIRDLPYVLEAIGLVKPDGSSRKPDHDKVNQFLVRVIEPLMAEAAARFDPTVDDGSVDGTHLDETGTVALLQEWREQAWRNAERLDAAPTPAARAAVEADIERYAARMANLIVLATAYTPAAANSATASAVGLGATVEEIAPAAAGRSYNLAHGVLGGLFTDKRAARNTFCSGHWQG